MKTKDFLKKHSACADGAKWALSISGDMVDVWETLIKEEKHDWLLWTATRPGVFSDSVLRKLACRFVRETPLTGGRVVWDLLTDERSCRAVEVAEAYIDGKATDEELDSAYATGATQAVAYAARAAADAAEAAYDVYDDYAAARAAAYAAYDSAYTTRAARASSFAAYAAYAYAAARGTYVAARAAAYAAQIKMIAEIGNPFRKGQENE
jgi:hypothetical protein